MQGAWGKSEGGSAKGRGENAVKKFEPERAKTSRRSLDRAGPSWGSANNLREEKTQGREDLSRRYATIAKNNRHVERVLKVTRTTAQEDASKKNQGPTRGDIRGYEYDKRSKVGEKVFVWTLVGDSNEADFTFPGRIYCTVKQAGKRKTHLVYLF